MGPPTYGHYMDIVLKSSTAIGRPCGPPLRLANVGFYTHCNINPTYTMIIAYQRVLLLAPALARACVRMGFATPRKT